jgi:hypothetical protein
LAQEWDHWSWRAHVQPYPKGQQSDE